MKKFYTIQAYDDKAEVYIFGDIGMDSVGGGMAASQFTKEIQSVKADKIHVRIDSRGGSVSDGWAMFNALRNHPAQISTYGDGFVASAALFPFLAGDERYASSVSAYYLHPVVVGAQGYAKDLRAAADDADMMTEIGVKAFVERAGMDPEVVRALMKKETWLTPVQALDYGIATAIIGDSAPRYAQSCKKRIFQAVFRQKEEEEEEEKKKYPEKPDNRPLDREESLDKPEDRPEGKDATENPEEGQNLEEKPENRGKEEENPEKELENREKEEGSREEEPENPEKEPENPEKEPENPEKEPEIPEDDEEEEEKPTKTTRKQKITTHIQQKKQSSHGITDTLGAFFQYQMMRGGIDNENK